MNGRKAIYIKIYYFHVLTSPLEGKLHTDSKTDPKKFHTLIEVSRAMTTHIFKIIFEKLV
jgi:hypothetical protein